ncbi:copper resistance CopC family protein [Ureibacillus aquaedulcis]|uniref:Copper resistance protein CopC n=1 Tax=Ureibacillus aquaedulcis TaxID=3058421 RepID=A0ABT8GTY0_9BACL|nr:copper resistance CopC family protein [Ureibacillus sp. BA0131]MDN4494791.1 copper resistance protein CopC [Ureibacillus sp. BA0131]
MVKKFLIFSLIFLFSFGNDTFAHTHIESSSPQSGEVLTAPLEEITLTFEGKIEQSSSFTLQNAAGEAVSVDNIAISENVLSGSLTEPIENGEYLINWNIIGADGHLIEGEVPFTVDVPVTEATENAEDETLDEEVTGEENNATIEESATTNNDAAVEESTENSSSSYLVPTLIGILILIVVGSFFFIAKRKQ